MPISSHPFQCFHIFKFLQIWWAKIWHFIVLIYISLVKLGIFLYVYIYFFCELPIYAFAHFSTGIIFLHRTRRLVVYNRPYFLEGYIGVPF